MKAKIYTKTGDQGQTSLVGGTRVSKTDPRLEAYGTLDELNSILGLVRAELSTFDGGAEFTGALQVVQNNLFNIGSHLACEDPTLPLPSLSGGALQALETSMDQWEAALPALRNFILPGGSRVASFAHLARTVCRRAERLAVGSGVALPEHLVYLNRLSDWLFLLARVLNFRLGLADLVWEK